MSKWIPHTLERLNLWLTEKGSDRREIKRIIDGLMITERNEPAGQATHQRPTLYFPNLAARPWWDAQSFSWVEQLKSNGPRILRELNERGGVQSGKVQTRLTDGGKWSVLYLMCVGRSDRVNVESFPQTWNILNKIPGATTAGMVYFSAIEAGTHISPHAGFTNAHLRCHMTLTTSDGCRIRVGEETRQWAPYKILVFDDSFEHEVWNDSEQARLVLLFDIFHPQLSEIEVEALTLVLNNYRAHFMRENWNRLLTPA
jgi:aspartyl/asparaginyl beta-hydroxylase (cupin superfamily)